MENNILGDIEFLMTDDFAEFADKIKAIKTEKAEKTTAIKAAYEEYEAQMAGLDKQAADLYTDFKAKQATS